MAQKYFILLFFLATSAKSQIWLQLSYHTQAPAAEVKSFYQSQWVDTNTVDKLIQNCILDLNRKGYLSASVSEANKQSDTLFLHIHTGPPFTWLRLKKGNVIQEAITAAGFREKDVEGKPLSGVQYENIASQILKYLERNGYPFAQLQLDSMVLDSNTLSAKWKLTLNPYIQYDTIEIIGNTKCKKWYLQKYVAIRTGNPYNETTVKRIDNRLAQLPYIQPTKGTALYFYGNKCKPILFIDDRKANRFDGVIGFAPNNQLNDGSLLITGEANLVLLNLFGTGKSVDLAFRSFMSNSQELKFKFTYPYIFKSNLGVDYDLKLVRQDTSFLDVRNTLGLQYRIVGEDYLRFFYSVQSTTTITVDTQFIKQNKRLPDAADIVNYQYGISLKMSRYDYVINPRKGFGIDITSSIGRKNIRKNPTIDALVLTSQDGTSYNIYDSINLNMVQYAIHATADVFIPIVGLLVGRVQISGAHVEAPQLFRNELFRIGGIRTLKGFDEQVIFASSYMILNTELRYLIQRNAHIMIFWNGAYYENNAQPIPFSDTPWGAGAGINFDTGTGVFSLYYAVGQEFNNPINISRAKVHFGYVNFF